MPRTPPQPNADPDANALTGFPADGDTFQDSAPPAPASAPASPAAAPDPLADMRARMDRLERENDNLKRMIPPATATPPPSAAPQQDDFDSVDWDKELFANPKAALKRAVEIGVRKVETDLRAEYNRDKGTSQFWEKFYAAHQDLRNDHDLVEVTLNSNIAALANIPVEDAYEKLAELTRARILRYAGGTRKQPKARAEGGGGTPAATPPPPAEPTGEVHSISDALRERRRRRRGEAA